MEFSKEQITLIKEWRKCYKFWTTLSKSERTTLEWYHKIPSLGYDDRGQEELNHIRKKWLIYLKYNVKRT